MSIDVPTPGNLIKTVSELVVASNSSTFKRQYYTFIHTIPDSTQPSISWAVGASSSSDVPLNLTDSSHPVAVESGYYSFSIVAGWSFDPVNPYTVQLELDTDNDDLGTGHWFPSLSFGKLQGFSISYYLNAGAKLNLNAFHTTGGDNQINGEILVAFIPGVVS